ncbi:MAG: NAD kinase [Bacteroidales bacterium]|nr:NAD kinase [Bacteroidales bacterium]
MKVAVFGKYFKDSQLMMLRKVFDEMLKRGWTISVFEPFMQQLDRKLACAKHLYTFKNDEELFQQADLLFSIGGDGTFLETITLVRDSGIPVLGINMGRLGFLSAISTDEIEKAFQQIAQREYYIESRSLLRLTTKNQLFGVNNFALNEVSISKNHPISMVAVSVWIDDQFLNTYQADGLIVATPTGSTAYSLSCNGNILLPQSQNFIITPIAPHNLTVRPIIVPDSCKIRVKVERYKDLISIGLDSRTAVIDEAIEMLIEKEDFQLNLARLSQQDFFSTLRNKLNWGLDLRN